MVNRFNWYEKVNKDAERLEQQEHDLDHRKEKRQTRQKPWMEPTPPLVHRDPEEKIGLRGFLFLHCSWQFLRIL